MEEYDQVPDPCDAGGRILDPGCSPVTKPVASVKGSPCFSGKTGCIPAPEGTPLFSGHNGRPESAGSRDWLLSVPVFAHFLTLLKSTVFSRVKRVFFKNNDFNGKSPWAWTPFPLPNFSGFLSWDFSVGE
jgi:hypothetical protein